MGDSCFQPEKQRTTLSLSITVDDKKWLKLYAVENNTTIATLIHNWIQEQKSKEGN